MFFLYHSLYCYQLWWIKIFINCIYKLQETATNCNNYERHFTSFHVLDLPHYTTTLLKLKVLTTKHREQNNTGEEQNRFSNLKQHLRCVTWLKPSTLPWHGNTGWRRLTDGIEIHRLANPDVAAPGLRRTDAAVDTLLNTASLALYGLTVAVCNISISPFHPHHSSVRH